MVFLHVFLLNIGLSSALYTSSSPVVKLTQDNFEKEVLNSNDLWLVEFFAPWCGHCKSLAPEYEKAAKALKGIIKIGAVDMTTDQSVGSKYSISGYPTLKFFGDNKKSPQDYDGERNAKGIVTYTMKQAEQIAFKRIGAKPEPKREQQHQGSSSSPPPADDGDVIVLTESTFDSNVFSGEDIWYVEFYAPWCGHCKSLAPEWANAATKLKDQVKVAKVDATEEKALASRYGINGYPSIKIFTPASREPEDYNGGRDAESIVRSALNKLETAGKPLTIPQLVGAAVLKKSCESNVCILAFLPHIYDSSASERNRYIETFTESAKKNRGKPLRYLWVQAGDYYKFEQMLGLGSGYPAVIGISMQKNRFALMRSAYKLGEIEDFVRKLLGGNIALTEYKEIAPLNEVEAWDGNDHEPDIPSEDL